MLSPGHGMFNLGLGAQDDLGLFVRLQVLQRFTPNFFGGIDGRGGFYAAGPRQDRWHGRILGFLGGRW